MEFELTTLKRQLNYCEQVIPGFTIGTNIFSPLRKEKNPSFSINIIDNRLVWYDYGIRVGGGFEELQKALGGKLPEQREATNTISVKPKAKYTIIPKDFSPEELKYWNQYCINKQTLNQFDVYAADKITYRVNNIDKLYRISRPSNPVFAYRYVAKESNCEEILNKNGVEDIAHKIYIPLTKDTKEKWRWDGSGLWCDGYNQLGRTKHLIITKAKKDVMCLHLMGLDAISFNSETPSLNNDFVLLLKERYPKITLLYDNDETGIRNSYILSQKYNFNVIFVPPEYKCKDTSDMIAKYGMDKTKETLNNLLCPE